MEHIALATVMYVVKVRSEMVDFAVYRTAAVRALEAEPLYRADDGHYQFKYLPAFALARAPFAWMAPETAKAVWYALSVVLQVATPAVVCLVDRFGEMTPPWRVVTAFAAVLMSFTIFDLLGRALYARLMAVIIVSVAALALFVALAHLRARALA
jgi:hypothetical protein